MRIEPIDLEDAALVHADIREDERGWFSRFYCRETFEAAGLPGQFVQQNASFSRARGTLRGLHYQRAPHAEAKLVRCLSGAIYDVIADLRPDSPTYRLWRGFTLSAENRLALLVPEGFAHGFLTLSADALVTYLVTAAYAPHAESGVRFDDPGLLIDWPFPPAILSDKDRSWPALDISA